MKIRLRQFVATLLLPDGRRSHKKCLIYADCYIHLDSRSPILVNKLIETFLPHGAVEAAEDYCVPQYADSPDHVFTSAEELVGYMETHPTDTNSIYWRSSQSDEHTQVNVHYIDSGMILRVAVPADTTETNILSRLKAVFDTERGYITHETPPPSTLDELDSMLKNIAN